MDSLTGEGAPEVAVNGPDLILGPAPAGRYDVPTDLCVISTFFNPQGYRTKKRALNRFVSSLRGSGIPTLFVEGNYIGTSFALPSSNNVVHVECRDVMWQKERLLNLALRHLPSTCRKVAWLDADVLFTNPNWAVQTSDLLEKVPVVQPFDTAYWLPKNDLRFQGRGLVWPSFARVLKEHPEEMRTGNFDRHGHCGYAWAARRELLERHGLFDRSIAGGGDHLMAHAMGGDFTSDCVTKMVGRSTPFSRNFITWGRPFYQDVRSRVGVTPGGLLHLWHGDKARRRYSERSKELLELDFNPRRDIAIGPAGAWEWSSDRPELHRWAATYFAKRAEDARPVTDYSLLSAPRDQSNSNHGAHAPRHSNSGSVRTEAKLRRLSRQKREEFSKDFY